MRTGPRHPRLGRAVYRLTLRLYEKLCARRGIFRADSAAAVERIKALRRRLDAGDTLYLGGICASGTHNSGVALVEVSRERGPQLIFNNEEERFSGNKHTTNIPTARSTSSRRCCSAPGCDLERHRRLVLRLGLSDAGRP